MKEKISIKAKLARKIMDAVNKAKDNGVIEPGDKAIKTIKAYMELKIFKSRYKMKYVTKLSYPQNHLSNCLLF